MCALLLSLAQCACVLGRFPGAPPPPFSTLHDVSKNNKNIEVSLSSVGYNRRARARSDASAPPPPGRSPRPSPRVPSKPKMCV